LTASRDLLDANAWVALTAADHVHHARLLRYWESERAPEVVFCRITALALVRLLMNPRVMQHSVQTPTAAWELYQEWRRAPGILFLDEPATIEERLGAICRQGRFGSPGLTDAYVASFALASGCRLVSMDGGFTRFEGLSFLDLRP
jgi:toxin-antitoxin system PIN domain toxin